MKKEFVPYVLVLKLKELGFDEPCLAVYNNPDFKWVRHLFGWEDDELENVTNTKFANEGFVTAPTYSQCFKFFREKYNLYPSINTYNDKWLCMIKSIVSNKEHISGYVVDTINNGHPTFNTYEEAEIACLEKLIEIGEKK